MRLVKSVAKTMLLAGMLFFVGMNGKTVKAEPIPTLSKTPVSVNFEKGGSIKVPNRGKAERERMELERQKIKSRGQAHAGTFGNRETASGDGSQVVSIARKYLGRPYVWGAKGPYSFDCSGYTSYVFKMVGVYIPSYTGDQVKYGKAVAREDLKAGDLLFFNTYMSFGHVGIYIGNNQFIHASTGSKTVKISSFTSYYNQRYAGARRIVE